MEKYLILISELYETLNKCTFGCMSSKMSGKDLKQRLNMLTQTHTLYRTAAVQLLVLIVVFGSGLISLRAATPLFILLSLVCVKTQDPRDRS